MGVDAIAKRYFPLVVCAMLAVIALLQARGIGALIAGQLPAGAPAPMSASTAHAPASERMPKIKTVTAQPILARNAFDSKTGPLDHVAPEPTPEPTQPAPSDPDAAAEDPACPTGSVVLIADSEDPAWSFAMIRTSSGAKMRRVGDEIDGQVVKAITWDRVWLASGTGRCQLKLDIAANKTASPTPVNEKPAPTSTPAAPPKDGGIEPGAIRKISDNEYVVQRSVMDKSTGFAAELKKGSRLVPGKGIRIPKTDPTSFLGQVGINGGDIVRTINGFDMTDLDKTAEGYSRLKSAREITLGLERNGQPVTVTIKIE